MYGAWGSRQSCLALADLVNLENRMASFGIREANAIFEEWKSIHQIEVKKSVHGISPLCAHLPLLSLHYRRVLFVFFAKAVSVRKIADQCDRVTRRSWECDSVKSPAERKGILQSKC